MMARARPMIALGDHQAPRDRADAAFDEAGVMIEHEALDAGVAQPRLRPGQADRHRCVRNSSLMPPSAASPG